MATAVAAAALATSDQSPVSTQGCPAQSETSMKGILLWLIGLPIPIIILLYLFHVI